mgnify:CR=1 FL=1
MKRVVSALAVLVRPKAVRTENTSPAFFAQGDGTDAGKVGEFGWRQPGLTRQQSGVGQNLDVGR